MGIHLRRCSVLQYFDFGLFSIKHRLGLGGRSSKDSGCVFTIRSKKSKAKKRPSLGSLILKKQCHCFNLLSYVSGILVLLIDMFRNMFLKEKSRYLKGRNEP